MKKITLLVLLIIALTSVIAQSPQGFSYQVIVRDNQGLAISDQDVALRISLLQGTINGSAVYVETHSVTTNQFGLVNISVGSGTIVSGIFSEIEWNYGPYFIKIELDASGSGNYITMGTSQLLSVPYALFANTAGNVTSLPLGQNPGDILYWDGNHWNLFTGGQYGQALFWCNGVLHWGGCTPLVSTSTPVNITGSFANSGGEVINDGGNANTARGVCWSTTGSPVITDSHTTDGTGTGTFTSSLIGLSAGTTYFVRAYATNSVDTAYGNEVQFTTLADTSFTCGISTITDYDGNSYNTVQIGNQCWMRENLKTTHYSDGSALVDGTSAGAISDNYITKYWFVYNNTMSYKSTYGLLYTWAAVMNGASSSSTNPSGIQGVCPTGWHVPSDNEWQNLTGYLGGSSIAGGKLKEDGTAHWLGPNTGATNESGFTALPGGCRNYYGTFYNIGNFGHWWSATEYDETTAWYRRLFYYDSSVVGSYFNRMYGLSVRCLKDITTQTSTPSVITGSIYAITQTTTMGGGEVTLDGGSVVTARGVCWNTSGSPTISDYFTTDSSGTGTFTSSLTGLSASTTYFVRAYATNSVGTAYGNEVQFTTLDDTSFTCGISTIIDYDDNSYNTVQIGNQCWMKENLKTTHYTDGTALVDGTNAGNISGDYSTKYWFVYDNNISYNATYGLLYTWAAVMNGAASSNNSPSGVQGICPTDWHVPSDNEWDSLTNYLGGSSVAGGKLKEAGMAHWESPNSGATNESGFTALPGGMRGGVGAFYHDGHYGYWWSATEENALNAWNRELDSSYPYIYNYDEGKINGFSVRCLRNY